MSDTLLREDRNEYLKKRKNPTQEEDPMHLEERSRVTIERKTKKVDPLTTDEIEMICRWDTDERHET